MIRITLCLDLPKKEQKELLDESEDSLFLKRPMKFSFVKRLINVILSGKLITVYEVSRVDTNPKIKANIN